MTPENEGNVESGTVPAVAPPHPSPGLADVHRDVDFANRYRLEFIKHTMSLAAAVFVFTVAFIKDMAGVNPGGVYLVGIGWFAMIISMTGGLFHMLGWDRFYISYRNFDFHNKPVEGKEARRKINRWRRAAMFCQLFFFFIGIIAIAVFCLINL